MKITKSQLKRIIKEELQNVLKEAQQKDWELPETEIVVDPEGPERARHEGETSDLPGGLMDVPRTYISGGQTRKQRADEKYRVMQFAKDVADNVESLLTDPKEYAIDPALAAVTRGIESAIDRGTTTVETAWDKLKRISKEIERARWIQDTRPDPRPSGTGDYVEPNYPRIVPEPSNLEEQEDPEFPMTGSGGV